jgi:hypothetical protein
MTEEEQAQAAAYIKLQEDVRQLIVDTVNAELQAYGSTISHNIRANVIYSPDFESRVKTVVQNQMTR